VFANSDEGSFGPLMKKVFLAVGELQEKPVRPLISVALPRLSWRNDRPTEG
jgi:hypothetical protein